MSPLWSTLPAVLATLLAPGAGLLAADVSRWLPSSGLRELDSGKSAVPSREPDQVLESGAAFSLPAQGPELVRSFVIPAESLSAPFHVEAIQLEPGDPDAAVRAVIRVDASLEARRADGADAEAGFAGHPQFPGVRRPTSLVAAWTPWSPVTGAGEGRGWRLVPDSDLVVTIHLKPTGRPATIRPSVRLWFTPEPPARHLVTLRMANEAVVIRPGTEDASARDTFVLPASARLLAVYPDANQAARTYRLDLAVPDREGNIFESERLFEIPDWAAGQQEWYRFQNPVDTVAGSQLDLQIRYAYPGDAAEGEAIRWGPGTEDERGELYLLFEVEGDEELFKFVKAAAVHQVGLGIEGAESRPEEELAPHVELARLYADLGEYDTAIAHGLKAVSLDAGNARAHAAVGAAYVSKGHDFAAQEQLEKAVALDPDLAEAHYNLGNVFLRYGVIDRAFDAYERAVELDRRDSRFANNLGHLLMAKERTEEAQALFQSIVERNPFHAPATANLGRILELNGKTDEAHACYRRAVALSPAMGPSLRPLYDPAARIP